MTVKRFVSVILLAAMPACMSTVRVAPSEYLTQNRPLEMMVVDEFGDIYVLTQPAVRNGQLVGIELGTPDTVSLPMEEVQEALVRQKSPTKTAFLVGTLTAMTVGGMVLALNMGRKAPCRSIASNEYAFENGTNQCDISGPDGTETGR